MSARSRKALQFAMKAVEQLSLIPWKNARADWDIISQKLNEPLPQLCEDVLAEFGHIVSGKPKELIGDREKFIEMLKTFDPNSIAADALPNIQPLTHSMIERDVIPKLRPITKYLRQWVMGMRLYVADQERLQRMAFKKGSLSEKSYEAYEAAMTALDDIDISMFTTVMTQNSEDDDQVLEAVAILLPDTRTINDVLPCRADPAWFVHMIQTLDPDSITADTLQEIKLITSRERFTLGLKGYVQKMNETKCPREACSPERSTAAAILCQWVLAMQEYLTLKYST